jgi:nucleoid-associated protein YgaU
MVKYIIGFFISILLISPAAFCEEGAAGYLEGGPSEAFEAPSLDLGRSYYGTFEKEKEFTPAAPRTREAKPLREPVIKEVPTVAEVESAKAKATAEAAIEASKRAETTANEAKQEAAQANTTSNQAIAAANQAIDKTNQAIDEVNKTNENLVQENAKIRFEMEQRAQALEQKDQVLSDSMIVLNKAVLKLTAPAFVSYRVREGDFLAKIAGKKNLGGGEGLTWERIYQANRDKIKDPNIIYPGQELQIPTKPGVKVKAAKKAVKKPPAEPPKEPAKVVAPVTPAPVQVPQQPAATEQPVKKSFLQKLLHK